MRRIATRAARAASRDVLERVARARARSRARELERTAPGAAAPGPWWDWRDGKRALEYLFWSGQVTSRPAARTSSGSTTCPSACCRAAVLAAPDARARPTPSASSSAIAARALGVGDRARPARLLPPAGRRRPQPRVAELVEAGELRAGRGRGLERAGLPATATPAARAASTRARCSSPVRLADLGARRAPSGCSASATGSRSTCRAPKRVLRLLRAAVPARRPARRAGRPQGRPPGRACCSSRRRTPSPTRRPETAAALADELALHGRLARPHAKRVVSVRPAPPSSATRISAPPPARTPWTGAAGGRGAAARASAVAGR